MLVKVLDENRVKILMEDQDIAHYDLPFEKLDYDDPVSKAFLYDLIHKTYERTGVDFKNCRVMIEVIPGVSGAYYILLTRMKGGKEKIQFDKAECCDEEMYIFKLEQAADVPIFFKQLQTHPPKQSALYRYGDAYYAVLSFSMIITNAVNFNQWLYLLEEFGTRCRYHYANEGLLQEWGLCILEKDAYDCFNSS